MARFANAQDLVKISSIRHNAVVLEGGRLIKVIMVSGVNFSLKSEEEQNVIIYAYQNFLNSLDFPIQIIIHSRKINIEKYLAGLEKRQAEEQSPLLQNQIGEYREFVSAFVKENPIMEKTFLVVVPFSPSVTTQTSAFSGIFPLLKRDPQAAEKAHAAEEETFTHNIAQLDQRVNQVLEGLRAIGLQGEALTTDALIELFYNFYNPETIERENLPIPKAPQQKEGEMETAN